MKRLLCFQAALSALALLIFYRIAASSPLGADVVMGGASFGFGILSIAAIVVLRQRVLPSAAAVLSAVFWFSAHPDLLDLAPQAPVVVGMAVTAAAFIVAAILEDAYGQLQWAYARTVLATLFGLGAAVLAQHVAYQSEPGDPLLIGIAFEAAFFLIAFAAAPWRPADLRPLSFARTARRRRANP